VNLPSAASPTGAAQTPLADARFGSELRLLFHRLNNQLGIILAHAELLEAKAADNATRTRAEQVVTSALDAMGTAKAIRQLSEAPGI
jgi:hypothetical protein